MPLTKAQKKKIEEEEKYRHAVAASITDNSHSLKQKHGIPLLLSIFIPGVGQIVKGQVKKGLLIFTAPSIAFLILLISGSSSNGSHIFALMGQFWFAGVILYFWQLYDAYNH